MALSPLISADDNIRARMSRAGVLRALHRWQALPVPARPAVCGTLLPSLDDADAAGSRRAVEQLQMSRQWLQWLDAGQASDIAGVPLPRGGVYFPTGQMVRPEPLLEALLGWSGVACVPREVAGLCRLADGDWQALDSSGGVLAQGAQVVLANARHAGRLLAAARGLGQGLPPLPRLNGMGAVAGQVSHYPAGALPAPRAILAGQGYCLPPDERLQVVGSTYVRGVPEALVTQAGHREIAGKLEALLGRSPGSLAGVAPTGGWAGWRAAVVDRLPIIGEVAAAAGLWLACGYGSRGLTWSSLAGEIIGASLDGEPAPLERDLLVKCGVR